MTGARGDARGASVLFERACDWRSAAREAHRAGDGARGLELALRAGDDALARDAADAASPETPAAAERAAARLTSHQRAGRDWAARVLRNGRRAATSTRPARGSAPARRRRAAALFERERRTRPGRAGARAGAPARSRSAPSAAVALGALLVRFGKDEASRARAPAGARPRAPERAPRYAAHARPAPPPRALAAAAKRPRPSSPRSLHAPRAEPRRDRPVHRPRPRVAPWPLRGRPPGGVVGERARPRSARSSARRARRPHSVRRQRGRGPGGDRLRPPRTRPPLASRARPPRHRPASRRRRRGEHRSSCPGWTAETLAHARAKRRTRACARGRDRAGGPFRARRSPPARHHPPRRQADQRALRCRGRNASVGLRGRARGRRVGHGHSGRLRRAHLPEPGATRRSVRHGAERSLLGRRVALRDIDGQRARQHAHPSQAGTPRSTRVTIGSSRACGRSRPRIAPPTPSRRARSCDRCPGPAPRPRGHGDRRKGQHERTSRRAAHPGRDRRHFHRRVDGTRRRVRVALRRGRHARSALRGGR